MNLPKLKIINAGGIVAQDESMYFGRMSNARSIGGMMDTRAELVRRANVYPELVAVLDKLVNLSSHPYFVAPSDLPAWGETIQRARDTLAGQ